MNIDTTRVIELIITGVTASIPGIIAIVLSRRKDEAEALKNSSQAEATLSDSSLKWVQEFKHEMEQLKTELKQSKIENSDLKAEILRARTEIAVLQSDNSKLGDVIRNIKKEYTEENTRLNKIIVELQAENTSLKSVVKAQAGKILMLENRSNGTPCN